VPEFLSPAWITELDAALRALGPTEGATEHASEGVSERRFVVEQRVTRSGADDHVHHVVASGAGFRAAGGPAPAPDLVLTTDLQTAIAIQRGAVNAELALAAGHLRLGGDLDRLLANAQLFTKLDDVFATLRDHTTYPTGSAPDAHR
jgi:putative sterol carrier protein